MAHRKCWQRIIDDNLDMAMILEDDAMFGPEIFEVQIPDCDIYYIGYNRADGPRNESNCFVPASSFEYKHAVYALHCYVVTRRGAEKLVKLEPYFLIDLVIARTDGLDILCHRQSLSMQEEIPTKHKNVLENLFVLRDEGTRYILDLKYKGINLWCFIFLMAGVLKLPLVLFSINKQQWKWYTIGRVISKKLFSSSKI